MKKTAFYLVALIIALILFWWWLGMQEDLRQRGTTPDQVGFADSTTLNRMVLMRHNQPNIVVEKDAAGIWQMTEPVQDRANVNMVRQLVIGLSTMELLVKVSDRTSQRASFQIDDVQAAHVQAFAGDELQGDIYIGKPTPNGLHVYVRQAGSDDIYTATGGRAMAALQTRRTEDYRDRGIYDMDISALDSLEASGADLYYRIARVDSASWRVRVGTGAYEDADQAMTGSIMRAFGSMRATGFGSDSLDLAWDNPELTVRAWKLGGDTEQVEFLKVADEENYWVRVAGKRHIYKVFPSVYTTFSRDPAILIAAARGSS